VAQEAAERDLDGDSSDYLEAALPDSFDDMSRDDLGTYDDIDSGGLADAASIMDSDAAREMVAEHNEAAGDEFNEPLSDWSTTSKSGQGEGLTALDMAPAYGSLRDHLLQQLGSLRLSKLEQHLCMLIVDSLDPAGYLRESLEELAELSSNIRPRLRAEQGSSHRRRRADCAQAGAELRSGRDRGENDRRMPHLATPGAS
jgi:hypothetical protein